MDAINSAVLQQFPNNHHMLKQYVVLKNAFRKLL